MGLVKEVVDYVEKYFLENFGTSLNTLKRLAKAHQEGRLVELPPLSDGEDSQKAHKWVYQGGTTASLPCLPGAALYWVDVDTMTVHETPGGVRGVCLLADGSVEIQTEEHGCPESIGRQYTMLTKADAERYIRDLTAQVTA